MKSPQKYSWVTLDGIGELFVTKGCSPKEPLIWGMLGGKGGPSMCLHVTEFRQLRVN
ncbi:hypothetical protein M1M34_gp119 [Haloarcula tailed virus 2]|uniref:Uncharacterized protein n=1 Tax=Haloarcula tailed virus 2 TaxID=2877989 RepID=A0AAE9BYS6_9CAUD|nr:hypothetical protein M1M34_gp119 [Haloarcula tailed virus 2]UBF23214.1 hypothetical protein HATV-2_gp63 [Haloarcula tailed virus 2]